ncbi:MAG: TRAP transporter small permease subunit [Acidobacteriota bacterium]|nr:TRAP transporter small permease subunit [Acidobacteriota bacterium]
MDILLRIANTIDKLTDRVGRWLAWLTLFMVLVGAFNAVARYLSRYVGVNLSSNSFLEMQWYAFSIVFLLGGVYALKNGAHVRVDVLYGRLGNNYKVWINLVGTVIFLIPFCIFMLWASWPDVVDSWEVLEVSSDPGGLPRYPIKTVVLLAFVLLLVQALAELIKLIAVVRGALPDDLVNQQTESEGL